MNSLNKQFTFDISQYTQEITQNPWEIVTLILDILIVAFLIYEFIKLAKKSKVWQLIKGIFFLIIITILSGLLKMHILNFILSSIMTYGVIALLIIFQPELRRGLERLGSNTILTKFFGIDESIRDKTRETIYKVAIATEELSKTKTGALIIFEREVKLQDIIDTGIQIDAEVSPQLLVNTFVPNTPLHDGAVVISNNKVACAAAILPLADDKDISKKLGTRHRAAIGISKETDAISVVVSEETGKISIARDGTLIADVTIDSLKRILFKQLVTSRFGTDERAKKITDFKNKINSKKQNDKNTKSTEIKDTKETK